jgi:hypothetical protein
VNNTTDDETIWHDDLLDRRRDAAFLMSFLNGRLAERKAQGRVASYVLNLDARWGTGKTFFLERLHWQLQSEGHPCAYVNAWRDDHADDPLISVMAAIDDALTPLLGRRKALRKAWEVTREAGLEIAGTAIKHGLRTLAVKAIGSGMAEIEGAVRNAALGGGEDESVAPQTAAAEALVHGVEAFADRYAEQALAVFRREKASVDTFRDNLRRFTSSIGPSGGSLQPPLFVLVDELDRCRPTYAIKLLERIKHLFEVNDVAFILATDSEQLRHSICEVYGASFDSGRYLLRFFDRPYVFEKPELGNFVAALWQRHQIDDSRLRSPPANDHIAFFIGAMQCYGLELRDAEQCIDILRTVMTVWPYPIQIELLYLLPLIVAFQTRDSEASSALEARDAHKMHDLGVARAFASWQVSFRQPRVSSEQPGEERVDVLGMLRDLLGHLNEPLNKIDSPERAYPSARYLTGIFEEEFARLRQNRFIPDRPDYSVLREYPMLVRNAGRLLAPAPEATT